MQQLQKSRGTQRGSASNTDYLVDKDCHTFLTQSTK